MNKTDVVQKNRYVSLENYEGDDKLRNHHEGVERTYEELLTKENNKSTKRNITILGDSLTKDMKSYKMKQGMSNKEKVYIRSFPGATVECMRDYVQPSLKFNPDAILLHCGTNDLRTDKCAEEIANNIINLAKKMKSNENEIIISSIFIRKDELNAKGIEVNDFLKIKCIESSFLFCDNSNISSDYLNASGLHLKPIGTIALANNFLKSLKY